VTAVLVVYLDQVVGQEIAEVLVQVGSLVTAVIQAKADRLDLVVN